MGGGFCGFPTGIPGGPGFNQLTDMKHTKIAYSIFNRLQSIVFFLSETDKDGETERLSWPTHVRLS